MSTQDSYRGIYGLGAIACIVVTVLVAAAVVLYFIWPYAPGRLETAEILALLAEQPLAGLMTLDLSMVVIAPVNTIVLVALFGALRRSSEPFALLALVFGAVGFATLLICRPVLELLELGRAFASSPTVAEREVYLTIAERLLLYYEGTAWVIQTVLYLVAGLIFAILMRDTPAFGPLVSVIGIVVAAAGLGFAIPVVGALLLLVNTIGTVVWYPMVARSLWKLRLATQA